MNEIRIFYISKILFHSFFLWRKKEGNKKWDNWRVLWIQDDELRVSFEWRSYDHDKTRGRKRRKIRWFLEKQFGTKKKLYKKITREGEKLRKILCVQECDSKYIKIYLFIFDEWNDEKWKKKREERMEKIRINIDHLMIMECKMSFLKCFLLLSIWTKNSSWSYFFVLLFDFYFHSWKKPR